MLLDDQSVKRGMAQTLCQVTAIVIGLDDPARIVSICVKSIEMSADMLDWPEVLDHCCSCLKHFAFRRDRLAHYLIRCSSRCHCRLSSGMVQYDH